MQELKSLPERYAKEVVDDEKFLRGDVTYTESDFELRSTGLNADLSGLKKRFDEVVEESEEPGEAKIDKKVASDVHEKMDIDRKDAANEEIWYYLTVVWAPDFVRYRWPRDAPKRTHNSMMEKFLGGHRDIYANALHRLWWIAEITHDEALPDPYKNTERAFGKQALANKVFDRDFGRSSTVAKVCIESLHDESDEVVEETTTRLNHALSTIPVESVSEEYAEEMVERIREDVKS